MTPTRWLHFTIGGQHFVIRYELSTQGILNACRVLVRWSLVEEFGISPGNVMKLALSLEKELHRYEQLGVA